MIPMPYALFADPLAAILATIGTGTLIRAICRDLDRSR